MCAHPKSVKRERYIIVRGYRCRQVLCTMCRNEAYRSRTLLRRAFKQLASMPAP